MSYRKWLYEGSRPNLVARLLNRGWAFLHSLGISPDYLVTLEVVGRQSGKTISFPLVMVVMDGQRYLVSMLGEEANWVRNVRAAGGKATMRHGLREEVLLENVEADDRAPIIKAYLQIAPGARPHISVDKDAPLSDFADIAPKIPVFRIGTLGS